jgi:hypothetical protein
LYGKNLILTILKKIMGDLIKISSFYGDFATAFSTCKYLEIDVDVDCNSQSVYLPQDGLLYFTGGVLKNFGILNGQNTAIESIVDTKIFCYDRTSQYIDGNFNIPEWKVAWFGVVNDGEVHEESQQIIPFSGTDNYDGFQKALDCAYKTFPKKVIAPKGTFRILKGLQMGYTDFCNINFLGETGVFKWYPENQFEGTTLLCEGEYGISVNSSFFSEINGITIIGMNYPFLKNGRKIGNVFDETDLDTREGWIGDITKQKYKEEGFSRYCPYGGIIVDGFRFVAGVTDETWNSYIKYDTPSLPPFVSVPIYFDPAIQKSGTNISTNTKLIKCCIQGFVIGVAYSASASDYNNDFNDIENCLITNNAYNIVVCHTQSRLLNVYNSRLGGAFTVFDNKTFGQGKGCINMLVTNCDFESSYQIIDLDMIYAAPCVFKHCGAESIYKIGSAGTQYVSKGGNAITFEDCFLRQRETKIENLSKTGIPFSMVNGPVNFVRCYISTERNLFVVGPLSRSFEMSDFKYDQTTIVNLADQNLDNMIRHIDFPILSFNNAVSTNDVFQRNPFSISQIFEEMQVYGNGYNNLEILKRKLWERYEPYFDINNIQYNGNNNTLTINITDKYVYGVNDLIDLRGDIVTCHLGTGIITGNTQSAIIVTLTNNFKKSLSGVYTLIESHEESPFFRLISSKQKQFNVPIMVDEVIDNSTIKINTSHPAITIGRKLDFFTSYPNNPFTYGNMSSIIADIYPDGLTIQFLGDIYAQRGQHINGYFLNSSDTNYDYWAENFDFV